MTIAFKLIRCRDMVISQLRFSTKVIREFPALAVFLEGIQNWKEDPLKEYHLQEAGNTPGYPR